MLTLLTKPIPIRTNRSWLDRWKPVLYTIGPRGRRAPSGSAPLATQRARRSRACTTRLCRRAAACDRTQVVDAVFNFACRRSRLDAGLFTRLLAQRPAAREPVGDEPAELRPCG